MDLQVIRYSSSEESTLGLLLINREFACYTLEDEARTVKVFGETRIPAGHYEVRLRTEGRPNMRYASLFPEIHIGMLHIMDVPDFKNILIHIGNTDTDTAGCLLVGNTGNNNQIVEGRITGSTNAYKRIYPIIADAIASGEGVSIICCDQIPELEDENVAEKSKKSGFVNTSRLNLRVEPGVTNAVAGILNRRARVQVVKKVSGWQNVTVEGWVKSEHLDLI